MPRRACIEDRLARLEAELEQSLDAMARRSSLCPECSQVVPLSCRTYCSAKCRRKAANRQWRATHKDRNRGKPMPRVTVIVKAAWQKLCDEQGWDHKTLVRTGACLLTWLFENEPRKLKKLLERMRE